MRDILLFIIAVLLFVIVLILLPFWVTIIILLVLGAVLGIFIILIFWDNISDFFGAVFGILFTILTLGGLLYLAYHFIRIVILGFTTF
tara:strand:- start:596 stop:859 length:264 start_codon:yes stop_codon:yes gene_type:complete